MKRKLLTFLLGICLVLTLIPSAAFAETEVDTAEKLKEKLDEAAELIHGQEMETDLHRRADGSYSGTEFYDLGDGAQLIVEITDIDTDGGQTGMMPMSASSGSSDLWRDFGNRSFVAKATIQSDGRSITLQLTNNYILSVNGIDIHNLVADSDYKIGSVQKGVPKVTDSSARTPGSSDVNGTCKYTVITKKGGRAEYQMNSTVGYVALDKAGKRIKVRQSWSLTKL